MKNYCISLITFLFISCQANQESNFCFDNTDFLIVEGYIKRDKQNFIFDTCAEATAISEELVKELNLIPHRQILINKKTIVDVVYIPSLEINGIRLFQVEAAVLDMNNETFIGTGYAGILGLNVINLFVWDFDLKNQQLELHGDKPKIQQDCLVFDYSKIQSTGLPFLKMETDFFTSDSVYFDTGFTGFLSLNHIDDTTKLDFQKFTFNKKNVLGDQKHKAALYSAKDFHLLGKHFNKETILYNIDPKEDKELIGSLFIQTFDRFIFDPINSQIFLSK